MNKPIVQSTLCDDTLDRIIRDLRIDYGENRDDISRTVVRLQELNDERIRIGKALMEYEDMRKGRR